MNALEKEIVLAFAECNMDLSKTARKTYMHRNSIVYQLEKIQKKTGLQPKRFFDLIKLVEMCKEVAV